MGTCNWGASERGSRGGNKETKSLITKQLSCCVRVSVAVDTRWTAEVEIPRLFSESEPAMKRSSPKQLADS